MRRLHFKVSSGSAARSPVTPPPLRSTPFPVPPLRRHERSSFQHSLHSGARPPRARDARPQRQAAVHEPPATKHGQPEAAQHHRTRSVRMPHTCGRNERYRRHCRTSNHAVVPLVMPLHVQRVGHLIRADARAAKLLGQKGARAPPASARGARHFKEAHDFGNVGMRHVRMAIEAATVRVHKALPGAKDAHHGFPVGVGRQLVERRCAQRLVVAQAEPDAIDASRHASAAAEGRCVSQLR